MPRYTEKEKPIEEKKEESKQEEVRLITFEQLILVRLESIEAKLAVIENVFAKVESAKPTS